MYTYAIINNHMKDSRMLSKFSPSPKKHCGHCLFCRKIGGLVAKRSITLTKVNFQLQDKAIQLICLRASSSIQAASMTSLTFILCNLCPRNYICIHEVWLTIRRVYYIRYCLSILNILSQLVMKIKNQTMGNDEIQKPLHSLNKYTVGQLGLIL